MKIYLYPNNRAFSDTDPLTCIGTNDTYGLPAKRTVPYGKTIEDVEKYKVGNDVVFAFFTHDNYEARQQYIKNLQRYGKEYYRNAQRKHKTFAIDGLRTL